MRILSGTLARQEIIIPSSLPIRPTSAKVRGQVFNICRALIQNEHVLDICAGSGAIGIEALSQGACHATFIEKDPVVLSHLKKNISKLHIEPQCTLIQHDASTIIPRLTLMPISLIYIDPPYLFSNSQVELILTHVTQYVPHTPWARIFVERSKKMASLQLPTAIRLISERSNADTTLFEYGFV